MPASTIDGQRYLAETRKLVDRLLDRYLPSAETVAGYAVPSTTTWMLARSFTVEAEPV